MLITVKAAPNPSAIYGETVCVAGIRLADTGPKDWIRLYPINFRHLPEASARFKKYDIVTVEARPAGEARLESWRPNMATLQVETHLPPWKKRRQLVDPMIDDSMCKIRTDAAADPRARSLALVRPAEILPARGARRPSTWHWARCVECGRRPRGTFRQRAPAPPQTKRCRATSRRPGQAGESACGAAGRPIYCGLPRAPMRAGCPAGSAGRRASRRRRRRRPRCRPGRDRRTVPAADGRCRQRLATPRASRRRRRGQRQRGPAGLRQRRRVRSHTRSDPATSLLSSSDEESSPTSKPGLLPTFTRAGSTGELPS